MTNIKKVINSERLMKAFEWLMKKRIFNMVLGCLLLFTILLFPSVNAKAESETDLSNIIPADALCYLSLDTSEKSWSYFIKRFEGIKNSKSWKGIYDASQKEGVDLEKEILNLLGEQVIFAAYPYKDNKLIDAPPPFVIAALVKDPALAGTVLTKLLSKIEKDETIKFTKETYADTEISYFIDKEITPSFALNKNYIIFGNGPDAIKKVLDVAGGSEKNLLTRPAFTKIQKSLSSNQIWLYFNFEDIFNLFKNELDNDKDMKELLSSLKSYKEMGIGIGINEKGLKFKSCVVMDPDDKFLTKMFSVPAVDFSQITTITPKEPIFFLAFNQFNYWLESLEKFIPDTEIKKMMEEGTKELENFCGLNIKKDLFPNSNGVFATFGSISTEKPIPNFALIFGIKDTNKMTNVMKNFKFDMSEGKKNRSADIIKFNQPLTYRGTKMILAQQTGFLKDSGLRPGYFIQNNMLVVGSDVDALKKILDMKANNANALINYVPFISMQTRMGQKANSIGYVDLKTIFNMVLGFIEDPEAKAFLPTIQSFKAIGFNSYGEKGWGEGVFLFDIDMDKFDFEMLGKIFEENFVKANQQAKNIKVQENMRTFQLMLETFAVDNGGFYPKDLITLEAEATTKKYWKVSENPFVKDHKALIEFAGFKEGQPELGGTVLYKPIVEEKGITKYELFGCDEDGNLIKENNGEIFKITN